MHGADRYSHIVMNLRLLHLKTVWKLLSHQILICCRGHKLIQPYSNGLLEWTYGLKLGSALTYKCHFFVVISFQYFVIGIQYMKHDGKSNMN